MSPAATVSISKTLFSRGIHAQIFHLNKNLGAFALKQLDWQAIQVDQLSFLTIYGLFIY